MEPRKLSIYFFSSTHWDREWYQDFQGFRYRLVEMTNKMIDVLEKNLGFKVFHLDGQTIVLEDFAEIEPERSGKDVFSALHIIWKSLRRWIITLMESEDRTKPVCLK